MSFTRHVGKHGDRKVAIVFREVPNEVHMCLVTYTETLNQHVHDPLIKCIESDIGQNSEHLADALNRTYAKDGRPILQVLHLEGQLKKVQTSQIVMTPSPNQTIRLDELNKILLSPKPSIGFDLLYKTGLLEIIFPQMVALAGAEYIDGKGHKDNFYHTIQVVDNIALHTTDLWLRWAAVLHDIAKPVTKKFEEGHGWTFHGHEAVGGRMVPKIFTKLKLPQNEKMRFVRKLVELHLRPISVQKKI